VNRTDKACSALTVALVK